MAFLQALWWSSPGSRAAELEEEEDTCVPSPGGIPGPPNRGPYPRAWGWVTRWRGGLLGGVSLQSEEGVHVHREGAGRVRSLAKALPKPIATHKTGRQSLPAQGLGRLGQTGSSSARGVGSSAAGESARRGHARADIGLGAPIRRGQNSQFSLISGGTAGWGPQSPKAADRVHARGHPPQAPGEWERAAGTRLRGGTRCCPQAGLGQVTRWRRVLTEE